MRVRIRGKQWTVKRERLSSARGICDHPEEPGRTIRIAKSLKDAEELEVLLHEMLHAAFWDLDEGVVETVSEDLSAALWRMGYRKAATIKTKTIKQ